MHDYNNDGYIDRDEAFTLYENDPISDEQIERELDGVRVFEKRIPTRPARLSRSPAEIPSQNLCPLPHPLPSVTFRRLA